MITVGDIEFINPKEWNTKLTELNGGKRARYYEVTCKALKRPSEEIVREVKLETYQYNDYSGKVYYNVIVKPQEVSVGSRGEISFFGNKKVPGFKVTIKVADTLQDADTITIKGNKVASKVFGEKEEFNYFHSYTKKFTPLSKESQSDILTNQVLLDNLGVVIEKGDWVAYPDTVFATNKHYTKIFQVEKFGIGTVEGLSPEKLVVVKTNNPNKKLGWG